MKRIVFCFDGTWNKIAGDAPTNVARIAQSIASAGRPPDSIRQIIYYDEGVGTGYRDRWLTRTLEAIRGGVLGKGLDQNLIEAYHFLVLNYEPGDELFLFGFSRGAFTARSFAGMIRNCGIMSRRSLKAIGEAVDFYFSRSTDDSPDSDKARKFRFDRCPLLCLPGDKDWSDRQPDLKRPSDAINLRIKYIGVWDTVGALGVPGFFLTSPLFNRKYQFHDTALSSCVEAARHAVAADERRRTFPPALWSNLDQLDRDARPGDYQQQVFPGDHSSVGGGGPVDGLSKAALRWICAGAIKQKLAFDTDRAAPIHALRPDHRAALFNRKPGWWPTIKTFLSGGLWLSTRDFRVKAKVERDGAPIDCIVEAIDGIEDISEFLIRRYAAPREELGGRDYRPRSLMKFWNEMDERAAKLRAVPAPGDKVWDERALRPPNSVERYTIAPGDSLSKIAAARMGGIDDWKILFLHNRTAGLVHDPDELFAHTVIEIPRYAERGTGAS